VAGVGATTKIFVDNTKLFVIVSAMNQEPLQKPTASELEILRVLWERGPSTVREVTKRCVKRRTSATPQF